MLDLPIDEVLPDVLSALREPAPGSLVLEAPAGAGKTTRVPIAIARAPWCSGQVLVTEPRRIAASLSALRVAEELGQGVGREVGYSVRFDEKVGKDTKLVYLTEGLLLRRLSDPRGLDGVSALVFDEVHEQSADLELLLALVDRIRASRPELRLVAMSATLDAERMLAYWPNSRRVISRGRTFPVSVEYAPKPDDRPLEIQVRSAVRAAFDRPGDILVFLPGSAEIRRSSEALTDQFDAEVVPLHGDLPLDQQARAVRPSARRRIVLATNVAESSLTIDGVTTVIDSGTARVARHDSWSGIGRLEVEEISQARAVQRAGRAGRTQPGHAVRLYTAQNFAARPAQDSPEFSRTNLSDSLLFLRAAGLDERSLRFSSEPAEAVWLAAERDLEWLGASEGRRITELGRRMARLPLPVRMARLVCEAEDLGMAEDGCLAAALLAERDISRHRPGDAARSRLVASDSDLEDRLQLFREAADARFSAARLRALELDAPTVQRVERAKSQLCRLVSRSRPERAPADWLTRSLFSAFSDRLAARRGQGNELVLMNGATARLADTSAVVNAPFLLCLAADAPRGKSAGALVRLAHRIDADTLLNLGSRHIEAHEDFTWSNEKERVLEKSSLTFGRIVLDETIQNARPSPGAGAVLLRAARAKGVATFDPEARLEALSVRLDVLLGHAPDVVDAIEGADREQLTLWAKEPLRLADHALELAVETEVTASDLAKRDLTTVLEERLPPGLARALAEWVPRSVKLNGGLEVPVHYEAGRVPYIEARLQNFFGMSQGPSLCRGRLPLQLHFLAPNHRAVQVTTDLDGFWQRHYPTLRKELMRRYPKHLWPEDGRTARPPTPGKIR